MSDTLDEMLRRGDLEGAAKFARANGMIRRSAELIALAGRPAEAVFVAIEGGEWRVALDVAFSASDPGILDVVCDKLGADAHIAPAAAAHARLHRRDDVAARILSRHHPADAGAAFYSLARYLEAAENFERANELPRAVVAYEQYLAQSPDDVSATDRLAELRARRGDFEGVARALQHALHRQPTADRLAKLASALLSLGMQPVARAVLRRLQALEPTASQDLDDYKSRFGTSKQQDKRYAGRYRVIREVGSGASGRVLEAIDELTNEPVALKVLAVSDDRSGAFARFMREADLARSLDDPTLVRMRALDPDGPTIVYDWMPGGTLADRIETVTVAEARAITLRILRALEALHRNGVVHRDVKPTNVLFDRAGQARLGDLGAAHLSDLGATVTGGLVGSLPYMAPEQITGASATAATDVYALGCMLFQMLTGNLPFEGPDFVTEHVSAPVPRASQRRPALGAEYDALFDALLAKDPEQRPPDAAGVRELLSALSWTPVDESRDQRPRRTSTVPPPASAASERYAPLDTGAEHFRDARLDRLVDRVVMGASAAGIVAAWSRSGSSALQAVYETEIAENEIVAWVPRLVGESTTLERARSWERADATRLLEELGVPAAQIATFSCLLDPSGNLVLLLRGLRAS